MKKIFFCFMLLFLLTSCDFDSNAGNDNQSGNTNESIKDGVIPLYSQDTIKNNIASYSHSLKITTNDGIDNYEVKFDNETNAGIAIKQEYTADNEKIGEPVEYFFLRDKDNDCLIFGSSKEFNEYSFHKDNNYDLFYIRLLFDLSNNLIEGAPYDSKTEITYAGRKATKYVISNNEYVITSCKNCCLILDNETGAVLSLTYDYFNFYESTAFTPNDQKAKNDVIAKKNTIPFEYFDTRVLELVNLENITFPEGDLAGAGIDFKDFSSSEISNFTAYRVAYDYYGVEDTSFIKELCKYVYDQGIKYDLEGGAHEFEELYSEKSLDYYGTGMYINRINACIIIDGVTYNIILQGQSKWSEPHFWHVVLNIYVRE